MYRRTERTAKEEPPICSAHAAPYRAILVAARSSAEPGERPVTRCAPSPPHRANNFIPAASGSPDCRSVETPKQEPAIGRDDPARLYRKKGQAAALWCSTQC